MYKAFEKCQGRLRNKVVLLLVLMAVSYIHADLVLAGTGFGKGSRVMAKDNACVQNAQLTNLFCFNNDSGGVHGTIVGGPMPGNQEWLIKWDAVPKDYDSYNGTDTWSAQSDLSLVSSGDDVLEEPTLTSNYYTTENRYFGSYAPNSVGGTIGSLGNCTWYAYGRMLQLGYSQAQLDEISKKDGVYGPAYVWASDAGCPGSIIPGVTCDTTPAEGDIAVLDKGSFSKLGHVAVVEWVSKDKGMFTVTESSYADPKGPNYSTTLWNFLWRNRTITVGDSNAPLSASGQPNPYWFSYFIHLPSVTISFPTGQQPFSYPPVNSPVINSDPSQAKPIGVGSVANGGDTLSLQVAFPKFSAPVDIYLGIYAPAINPNIWIIKPDLSLQPASNGLVKWKENTTGPINESLYGDVPISTLLYGKYELVALVTPAGDSSLDAYYLWETYFNSTTLLPPKGFTAAPECNGTTPGITLSWSAVNGAKGYEIYRDGNMIITTSASTTSFWDTTGLTSGQSYQYQVKTKSDTTTSNFSGAMTVIAPNCSGFSISGRVTLNGAALPGVTLTLSGVSSVNTDSNGNYVFTGIQNGSYTITPSQTGYSFNPTNRSIVVNNANVIGQDFAATQTNLGTLLVSPSDGFSSSGTRGGPFTPSSKTYTLSNTGSTSIYWTASNSSNWLDLSLTSGTLSPGGTAAVTVSVNSTANNFYQGNYSGTLSFNTTNGSGNMSRPISLTVNNTPALGCTTTFNPTTQAIDASGGQRQVILSISGSGCTWSASSNQSWVHSIAPSSGTSGATLTYTVDQNTSTQSRSATITAGQATLTINQRGTSASCTFSLGTTSNSVPAVGGTFVVGLYASSQSCPRTAQSNASFITKVSPASGSGDANISYTVAPNTSTSPRSGTLTIAGQTFTVNQAGAAPPCNLPGAFSISVNYNWYDASNLASDENRPRAAITVGASSNATSYAIFRDGQLISNSTYYVDGSAPLCNSPYCTNPSPGTLTGGNHTYSATATNSCGTTTSSNNVPVQQSATVNATPGYSCDGWLRSTADASNSCPGGANCIAQLQYGTPVTITGGPQWGLTSASTYDYWWQISSTYGSGYIWESCLR